MIIERNFVVKCRFNHTIICLKSFGIDKIILAAYDYFALKLLYNFSTMVSLYFDVCILMLHFDDICIKIIGILFSVAARLSM